MDSRTLFTTALLLPLLVPHVVADGLPVSKDRTRYQGDHTVFVLSAEQQVEVERERRLVLTEKQHAMLLPLNKCLPMELPVVSSRYGDCTCGFGPAAIWARRGEIIVPHDYIDLYFLFDGEPPETCAPPSPVPEPLVDWKTLEIFFDSDATMWVEGESLLSVDLEQHLLAKLHPGTSAVVVHLPPPLDPVLERALQTTLANLQDLAKKTNLGFHWLW